MSYNRKKHRQKKTHYGRLFLIPLFFILFLALAFAGVYLYYDYHMVEKQEAQFEGMMNVAEKVVAQADSQAYANDYLKTIIEQTEENTHLSDLQASVTCENGEKGWNNGESVTISLKGNYHTRNPFLNPQMKLTREIVLSKGCRNLTMIPAYVSQTGIKGDYTNYVYFYSQWHDDCKQRVIADAWKESGSPSSDGIATLHGYYLVAVRPLLGDCGDLLQVVLEDGTSFMAMVADEKGIDAENTWGHLKGGDVSLIEFEVIGNEEDCYAPNFQPPKEWQGKRVSAVINYGGQTSEDQN